MPKDPIRNGGRHERDRAALFAHREHAYDRVAAGGAGASSQQHLSDHLFMGAEGHAGEFGDRGDARAPEYRKKEELRLRVVEAVDEVVLVRAQLLGPEVPIPPMGQERLLVVVVQGPLAVHAQQSLSEALLDNPARSVSRTECGGAVLLVVEILVEELRHDVRAHKALASATELACAVRVGRVRFHFVCEDSLRRSLPSVLS